MFNPGRRASMMTVGTAVIVLQMSDTPVIFGCAEVVAKRLCRVTPGGPAVAEVVSAPGGPQYKLTEYGQQVKAKLEKWLCLTAPTKT